MKYFNIDFFKFFDGLKKNNNKEWFDKNRSIYENEVKLPFRQLVTDVTAKMSKDVPELNQNISKAVFRINRDIRFSKDKSPYKTNVGAILSRTGTKDQVYPGFYMHFGADDCIVGGGKYFCEKEELKKIRQEIYYNNKAFQKILNDQKFKELYKGLEGEKSKILEPEYKDFLKEQPLIANKQFWFYSNVSRKEITGDNIDTTILHHFKAGLKLNRFLLEAIA
ncbi:MAG: DUF2461 domain-containing protein [Chitinophagales bacterium]|nr:DUF2461 domain-containing protein [Chitinophagales bacterium]